MFSVEYCVQLEHSPVAKGQICQKSMIMIRLPTS